MMNNVVCLIENFLLQNNIQEHNTDTSDQYYKTIFQKHDDEDADEYIRRICLMRLSYPSLSVWQGNAFLTYVKPNLLTSQNVQKTSDSPSLLGSTRFQGSLTLSNTPSPSSNYPSTSVNSPTPSPNYPSPSSNYPSTSVNSPPSFSNPTILSSPKAPKPVLPSSTYTVNPNYPQQTIPSAPADSTANVVYIAGKQKKIVFGQYGVSIKNS